MKLQLKTVRMFEVQHLPRLLDPVPSLHPGLRTDMQMLSKQGREMRIVDKTLFAQLRVLSSLVRVRI